MKHVLFHTYCTCTESDISKNWGSTCHYYLDDMNYGDCVHQHIRSSIIIAQNLDNTSDLVRTFVCFNDSAALKFFVRGYRAIYRKAWTKSFDSRFGAAFTLLVLFVPLLSHGDLRSWLFSLLIHDVSLCSPARCPTKPKWAFAHNGTAPWVSFIYCKLWKIVLRQCPTAYFLAERLIMKGEWNILSSWGASFAFSLSWEFRRKILKRFLPKDISNLTLHCFTVVGSRRNLKHFLLPSSAICNFFDCIIVRIL